MSILEKFKANNDLVEKTEDRINTEKVIDGGIVKAVDSIEELACWAFDDLGGQEAYIDTLSNAIILLHNKIKNIKKEG